MGDAINLGTMRHLSGRPAVRGPEQAAWDGSNPGYAQRWGMFPQQSQQGGNAPPPRPAVMPAYAPGRAQPQQSPYAASTSYGQPRPPVELADPRIAQAAANQMRAQRQSPNSPSGAPRRQSRLDGVYAAGTSEEYMRNNPDDNPFGNRPPPFQARTQNFDGTQSQMPNFQQRDAFISQINNQLGQMQNQSRQRPGMGPPQFNFPQMWNQAGQMAQQGFRNPFAVPGFGDLAPGAVGQPMGPGMYDILRRYPGAVF